jgi:hypothetical protein
MKQSYAAPSTRALPDVGLPEPRVSRPVLALMRLISGAYLRFHLGFERIDIRNADILVHEVLASMTGGKRLIIAFRHPFGDEAQLISWTMTSGVEREARRLGIKLPYRPLALFVHGYEVPRWGGALVRFLLPRMGAMPVHHSKLDSGGMARIRRVIEDGPYPLAIAPEGQVSYTSGDIPRLEQGTVRLGFQIAEKLAAAGRSEHVVILPLSVHNRYGPRAIRSLLRLVARIESFTGTELAGGDSAMDGLSSRLSACLEHLLGLAGKQYGLPVNPGRSVHDRVEDIVEASLCAAERILGIDRGPDDALDRLYRIRQIGWDRIYLLPGEDPRRMPPLGRAIADRHAGEAWYALRHMELADFAWYFRSPPPPDAAPLDVLVEYTQNLWDLANRLAGGAISGRINVKPKRAVVVAAPTIDLSERLPELALGRKAAYGSATSALENMYRQCIKEIADENQ